MRAALEWRRIVTRPRRLRRWLLRWLWRNDLRLAVRGRAAFVNVGPGDIIRISVVHT